MQNSKLKIRIYPEPILRKKCEEVKEIDEEIRKLIAEMTETMQKNNGAGLAAPQVGVAKRVIVVETEKGPRGFVNPQILEKSLDSEIMEEGCLSFPQLFLKIRRAKKIEMKAIDVNSEKIKIEAEGILARIFQHEIDHLDGILFIDRISFLQKLKIKTKLKQLELNQLK
jgi:peptide deformylase